MSRRKLKPLPPDPVEAQIESLTEDGRGLTLLEGKPVHVLGALAGERVRFRYSRMKRHHHEGVVTEVLRPSPHRAEPRCAHFGVCGGCSLQHLDPGAQIRMKQEGLADELRRVAKVEPTEWLPPLSVGQWGYRRKARLGVRYVPKKGRVLVGFRERGSSLVADLSRCHTLHPQVGERLTAIAELIDGLSIRERLPQIEVAMGDGPCVLVFRVLAPPSDHDLERLRAFCETEGLHIYLQDGGADSVRPLPGHEVDLHYSLPGHAVRLYFEPLDFTQVNLDLNRAMVDRALDLLDPQPDEQVLDLFCGVGNFSLALARKAAHVLGIEGDPGLVERAHANAERNGVRNVRFERADLYGELDYAPWLGEHFEKALLDPPRSGALQVLDLLLAAGVRRLVYVSCNPSTLARDADRLVNGLGYRLLAAGVMDMFPHTVHVESMAVFEIE